MNRIIVSGALANKPGQGGEAWVRLSWVLGLMELGCDVHFIEQIAADAPVEASAYFMDVVEAFGLRERATLIVGDGVEFIGRGARWLAEWTDDADLLVNISGHLTYAPVFERVARRAYVDIDPGHTQLWHTQGSGAAHLDGHDVFFTVGENIGKSACPIADCGLQWHKIRPPVVLAYWPASETSGRHFTTIANWRSSVGGSGYSEKVHEFRKVLDLPRRTDAQFELALGIHPDEKRDLAALHKHGWRLADPRAVSGTPEQFRDYVRGSGAEFSVAQGIYVQTHSGWFSDRTAHYLAAGRPALVQGTGSGIPSGEGLLTFQTPDEAAAAAREITGDHARHARAARGLAEEFLDSRKVLRRFLDVTSSSHLPEYAHQT